MKLYNELEIKIGEIQNRIDLLEDTISELIEEFLEINRHIKGE